MRRVSLVVSLLALLMASILLPATAKADGPFQVRFQGQSALAVFSSRDAADPCIFTAVSVLASDGRVQEPPGPPTPEEFASVLINRFNGCTGEPLLRALGFSTAPDFQIDNTRTSATLAATITVEDVVSGSSLDVFVAVAWTGTGEVTRLNQHLHIQEPGLIVTTRFNGAQRRADASGSVSDGVTDFTAGAPASRALLTWESSGVVEVSTP